MPAQPSASRPPFVYFVFFVVLLPGCKIGSLCFVVTPWRRVFYCPVWPTVWRVAIS